MQWEQKKLQDWHLRVMDILIADPTLTNEQIALELRSNVHPVTVGLLRRQDMFKLALEERQEEISRGVTQHTLDRINGKVQRLASESLDTLTAQVERERLLNLTTPSRGTGETCEMALKALGFMKGPAAPSATVEVTNVVQVDARVLQQARDIMRDSHARPHDAGSTPALPAPLALRAG